MDTTINDIRSPSLKQGNRNYQVFMPESPSDLIRIHHDDCFGTNKITDIQVEEGNTPSYFCSSKSNRTRGFGNIPRPVYAIR